MPERTCQRAGCGRPIPSRKRQDARWCSRSCESKARRAASRKARFEAANSDAAELLRAEAQTLAELHDKAGPPRDRRDDPRNFPDFGELPGDYDTAAEIDDEHQDNEQAARVRAMLRDDAGQRTPRETWKRWRSYGRRHGVEHPEQTADRIERHRAAMVARVARIDQSTAGRVQDRFDTRTTANVARNAGESRRLNAGHVDQTPAGSGVFDFQGEQVTGDFYRQGRASGQRSRHSDFAWNMTVGFIHSAS